MNRLGIRRDRNIGMLLLAIWLIAIGVQAFLPLLSGLSLLISALAIAAGVFILLGK